jgi:hypothetical protein
MCVGGGHHRRLSHHLTPPTRTDFALVLGGLGAEPCLLLLKLGRESWA